jgi:DNA (cytosine-5)-methyltransferase 1
MVKVYYSEFAAYPVEWLENQIKNNQIAGGRVDGRSIKLVSARELEGYKRCHFFAGPGSWEVALQQAGWPEDEEVWTGSCPCQSFSVAGKGKGVHDDRHLWPDFSRLIKARKPKNIFGEQVAGRKVTGKLWNPKAFERLKPEDRGKAEDADRDAWFNHVQNDLEGIGYVVGHCVFPACGVGSPMLRQRLYWFARLLDDPESQRREVCDTTDDGKANAPIGSFANAGHCGTDERGSNARYVGDDTGGRRREEQSHAGGMREGTRPTKNETGGSRSGGAAIELVHAEKHGKGPLDRQPGSGIRQKKQAGGFGVSGGVADVLSDKEHQKFKRSEEAQRGRGADKPSGCGMVGGLEHPEGERRERHQGCERQKGCRAEHAGCANRPGPTNGEWGAADWIRCRDIDKKTGRNIWRPVESGSSPLAHAIPYRASKIRAGLEFLGLGAKDFQRVLRESKAILSEARRSRNEQLKVYGNMIVIPQAVEFIRACMEEL